MKLSKLLGGAALGGLLAAGVAYAAVSTSAFNAPKAADASAFTATWAMGEATATGIEAVASPADVVTSSTVSIKGNITAQNKARTAQPSSGPIAMTAYNSPSVGSKEAGSYIEFVVNVSKPVDVTNVSFDAATAKHGSGEASYELVVDGSKTIVLEEAIKPARADEDATKDASRDYRYTKDVADVQAQSSIALRIYIWSTDATPKARGFEFANVVISGMVSGQGGDTPVDPDPDPVTPEVPAGWASIPGTLLKVSADNWQCSGAYKIENPDSENPNFGSIKASAKLATNFFCTEEGAYAMNYNFTWNKSGFTTYINFEVVDMESGVTEASTVYTFTDKGAATIPLKGVITTGKKTLKISFDDKGHGQYVTNFAAPTFEKIGTCYSEISSVTVEGVQNTALEGYDYCFNLPGDYAAETVALNVAPMNGTIAAEGYTVEGNKVIVPVPAKNEEKVVNIVLTPAEGAFCPQTEYKIRVYRIGGVVVSGLQVDGYEVATPELLEVLNGETAAATLATKVYTHVPAVSATFADGSKADATVTLEGTTAKAAFKGTSGADEKNFTFNVDGVHLYTPAEGEQVVKIVFDSANNQADGSWSNGLYTLRDCNDGWGGTQFKFRSNTELSWSVPSNIIVKQMKFCQLGDNYAPGTIEYVSSEGATVYLPSDNDFSNTKARYDLLVNIENHQAGEPIMFKFKDGSQPVAWFEFTVEEQALTGEPQIQEFTWLPTDEPLRQNHCVIKMVFDREMASGYLKYGPGLSKTAKAEGGSSTLYFSLWDLEWNTANAFEIPAGALVDKFGNSNEYPTPAEIAVGAPADVVPVEEVTVVSNIDEFKAAIASCMETNKTADAPRRVIFMKNGDYNLGTSSDTQPMLHLNKAFNVSIIGESRDGVVLRGTITGISYPVFSTRYSTNIYMENFTIRNDLDYGKERQGVGVAHYGGNRDIMVNMRLLSQQDTQVTGEQGYYYNCEIHGSVDYVCGGGNHFYDHCTFVQQNGGAIAAPSTSALLKWGYVFQNCTIKGANGYHLGRPWQNEPRCYWLNTTMEATCSANGWDKMGNLPTHFYEYGSKDKNGKLLDLSGRGNSPTSTNKYTPVLTDEEAAEFTVENVLGGTDSWLAPDEYVRMTAPAAAYDEDANAITWTADAKAAGYFVYRLGEFAGYVPGNQTAYSLGAGSRAADDTYTVRSMSANGTLSDHSAPVTPSSQVGIEAVGAENGVKALYYNLQGVRVSEDYQGVRVRVAREADGTRSVTKNVKL